ncbi:hypothetical protein QYF61_020629 [Mycteria americana]|uniref:Uncharacterized protein n=1 Tax=Mycteria americana TaxID=33587 RepID=A0AAN7PVG6_MYCAM|nr:hypothetical protein QYF61_020629 [Mycteria americana]
MAGGYVGVLGSGSQSLGPALEDSILQQKWPDMAWVNKKFKNIIQRAVPRLDSYEWQGVWDSMGKCLSYWTPPVFWNFTPEQAQNPEKLVKYKVCCHSGNSRETQIIATCWGLAHAYRALFNTIQCSQGEEKVSGSDDKVTGTTATPLSPATYIAVTPTPVTDIAVTPAPATGTATEPGNQPVPVSVAPTPKKKSWREDENAGPSQGEEEEEEELVNEMETTRSLSLSELRDMQEDFSRRPGKHIVTWLLQCWDNRASSLELEEGIDKAIGKGAQALSLWRQLPSAMKEKHPFKEDVIYHPGKWTTTERGIQRVRELAMLEVIYGDLDNKQVSKDPDEVWCIRPMWQKLVQSAPALYANSLAVMTWKEGEGPTVDEAASQLWEYEESISFSLVSAVEKLVQQLKEDRSYSPPVRTCISAIRSQLCSAQERGYRGYTGYPVVLPV